MPQEPSPARSVRLCPEQWVVLVAVFVVFGLVAMVQGAAKGDEATYQLPTALSVAHQGFAATVFGGGYRAANTPLPYLITAAMGRLVPLNIYSARALSMAFAVLSLVVLARLLASRGIGSPFWPLMLVLFMPYFLRSSFTYYMAIYGAFFALLALHWLDLGHGRIGYLLHGVFSACAVLCQQFYLAIPAGVVMGDLSSPPRGTHGTREKLTNAFLACAPMAVPILFFVAWGGITHPMFGGRHIMFEVRNVTAALVVLGCWCLPFGLSALAKLKPGHWGLLAVASALLTLFALPDWSPVYGQGRMSGIVFHVIGFSAKISPWLSRAFAFGFCALGAAALYGAWRLAREVRDRRLAWICTLLVVVYAFDVRLGERQLLPLVLCMLVLVIPLVSEKLVRAWVIAVVPIGSWYVLHWFFWEQF